MFKKLGAKPFDYWIFVFALMLVGLGIIMVLSASTPYAKHYFDDIYYYLNKQLFAAGIGLVLMLVLSFVDFRIYKKFAYFIFGGAFLLLILVLIPGIGSVYNGARRWINIGPGFQPSEIYKIAVIIFVARLLTDRKDKLGKLIKGFGPFVLLLVLSAVLLLAEPHLSGTIIVCSIIVLLMFVGGCKLWHFLILIIPTLGIGAFAVLNGYTKDRIDFWLDPFSDISDKGYQLVQSFYAISSGGLFGRGLGKSVQKFLYLPEQYNDFIFAILAEELGFIGCVVVVSIFSLLVFKGIKIATECEDRFGRLLAFGISALFFVQVALNILVVTGSIPTTGISLPLFSYGGTSLVICMGEIGILLNISRHKKGVKK